MRTDKNTQEEALKPPKKISKKTLLATLKLKQLEDYCAKLDALKNKHSKARKSVTLLKSEYFALIKETLEMEGNLLKIKDLCERAEVSRSGYYNWIKSEPKRVEKDEQDAKDFALVEAAFNFRGFPKGSRSIHMRLLHLEPPVLMNVKKIERLMRKYKMKFQLKGNGVERKISQMAISGRSAPKFTATELPEVSARRQQFVIMCARHAFSDTQEGYFVCIVDTFTKQVVASTFAPRESCDLVKTVLDKFLEEAGTKESTLIYEKDGQLESFKVGDLLRKKSQRNYILDNAFSSKEAPQQHFIGFIRDEVCINGYKVAQDGGAAVRNWLDYYNKDRYIWELNKLSPDEYDGFLMTGINPLEK